MSDDIQKSAEISECGLYRYTLSRHWAKADPTYALFIGLNPSTADATSDDPTLRRCMAFARDWGFGGLVLVNLFAFRATDPKDMKAAADPIGPRNDDRITTEARHAGVVVTAWGAHGRYLNRDIKVMRLLTAAGVKMVCLGRTKDGSPRHPLYLPKTAERSPVLGVPS